MKHVKVTIKTFKLSALKPHPQNPRVHPEPGSPEWEQLKKSPELDYFDPVIVNLGKKEPTLRNTLLSGHLRCKVLVEMGVEKVDAVVVDYDAKTHLSRMMAANNQAGEWNWVGVGDLLKSMDGEIDLGLTGFPQHELELMLAGVNMDESGVGPKPVEMQGAVSLNGRYILVYRNDKEKKYWMGKIGLAEADSEKVVILPPDA